MQKWVKVLKLIGEYPQGWLLKRIETDDQKQAAWRTDPKRAGISCCMGDIGTHAENLVEYITGLRIKEICADLTTFIKGRRLDDDGNCLIRYKGGAKGVLLSSQVSVGKENDLAIWVHGEEKSLEWHQEHPNWLSVHVIDGPTQIWKRGNDYIGAKSPAAGRATRLPFGHPEAFLEAFANTYVNFADTVRARINRQKVDPLAKDFPDVDSGLRGMQFIEAVVKSSAKGAKWVKM